MRIVIAEDMVLLRAGVVQLLATSGIEVVAEAGDASALMRDVALHAPDAAIVDIKMPPTHTDEGLRAAVRIRREHPGTAVLLLSSYLHVRYANALMQEQPEACGYLLKDRVSDPAVLTDALQRVARGECVLDPAVVATVLNRARVHDSLPQLSAREREILGLMAEGHSNSGISATLHLSSRTVETHVRNIFTKLDLPEAPDTSRRVLAVLRFLRR